LAALAIEALMPLWLFRVPQRGWHPHQGTRAGIHRMGPPSPHQLGQGGWWLALEKVP